MTVIGLGTAVVEVVRVGRLIERHGEHFLLRIYTDNELQFCRVRTEYLQHYAKFWVAKQAVARALGVGDGAKVAWRDIEACINPQGTCRVTLSGGMRDLAELAGADEILLSMSGCRAYAMATALVQQRG